MQLQSNNQTGNYVPRKREAVQSTPVIVAHGPAPTELTQRESSKQPHECLLACCSCDYVRHTITLPTFLELV